MARESERGLSERGNTRPFHTILGINDLCPMCNGHVSKLGQLEIPGRNPGSPSAVARENFRDCSAGMVRVSRAECFPVVPANRLRLNFPETYLNFLLDWRINEQIFDSCWCGGKPIEQGLIAENSEQMIDKHQLGEGMNFSPRIFGIHSTTYRVAPGPSLSLHRLVWSWKVPQGSAALAWIERKLNFLAWKIAEISKARRLVCRILFQLRYIYRQRLGISQ